MLVDTNVLVYAYDRAAPAKQARALAVLDALAERGDGALTTQVLAEFYVVVTRKLAVPLSSGEAYTRIDRLVRAWHVFDITGMIVLEAARGVRDHQLSFWDAQIWAAARLNQVPMILTEDLPGASAIEGVRYVDPFTTTHPL